MDDTREVTRQGHAARSLLPRTASRLSTGFKLRVFRGGRDSPRVSTLPVNGCRTISPSCCGCNPHLDWPFIPVAYAPLAYSRLGFSPKLGFDAAYHTTFPEGGRKTNQCPDKKSGGLGALLPSHAFLLAGAFRPQGLPEPRRGRYAVPSRILILIAFLIVRYQKRTNYMSNLIHPLPPLSPPPLRPPTVPVGAFGAQPCLAPHTPDSRPSPLPALPRRDAPPPLAPIPAPSPRCSVKGCVFPASAQERSVCRYHELLHSEGALFQSHQPTHLLSLQAPFGIPECEPDDTRQQDRKRQAAEREEFLMDEAA